MRVSLVSQIISRAVLFIPYQNPINLLLYHGTKWIRKKEKDNNQE